MDLLAQINEKLSAPVITDDAQRPAIPIEERARIITVMDNGKEKKFNELLHPKFFQVIDFLKENPVNMQLSLRQIAEETGANKNYARFAKIHLQAS